MSKVKTYLIIFTGPLIRSWSGWALNVIWRRLSDLHTVSFINKQGVASLRSGDLIFTSM